MSTVAVLRYVIQSIDPMGPNSWFINPTLHRTEEKAWDQVNKFQRMNEGSATKMRHSMSRILPVTIEVPNGDPELS